MWIQKDKLTKEISWNEVSDWVVIDVGYIDGFKVGLTEGWRDG